jgi:GrpB-like predicted nucleotidyltransferase (UPF0157 family)
MSDRAKNGLIGGVETIVVEIVDYQSLWPETFRKHEKAIAEALGEASLRIEHIGSTSVPGLAAKPIVDILVVVRDSADEDSYLPRMEAAGYELRVREPDFHEHRMFRTTTMNVHVTIYKHDSPEIERLLTFREWLRESLEARRFYEETKRKLAAQSWADVNAYAEAKTEAIEHILATAREAGDGRINGPAAPFGKLFCKKVSPRS